MVTHSEKLAVNTLNGWIYKLFHCHTSMPWTNYHSPLSYLLFVRLIVKILHRKSQTIAYNQTASTGDSHIISTSSSWASFWLLSFLLSLPHLPYRCFMTDSFRVRTYNDEKECLLYCYLGNHNYEWVWPAALAGNNDVKFANPEGGAK